MASVFWGLAAIAITAVFSRLILALPVSFVMGASVNALSKLQSTLMRAVTFVVLVALLVGWAILVLGVLVQTAQALSVPRWSFWICAAIAALLPQYLQQEKMRTFGSTYGDAFISTAVLLQVAGYLLVVFFNPLRSIWLNLFGLFQS